MVRLGDVFNLQMGKTPARANAAYWTNGKNAWVSISDLSSYEKYVGDTKEQITDLAVQESGIKAVPADTIIMSFKLSLGKTAITKVPIYTNEAIMAFLPTGKYDVCPDYFFHLFSGRDWSEGTNRAVMGATLNKATLSNMEVVMPPLDEQRRIAAVLDKVSGLIAKRRAQLDKLDELVKARFVEMFGDPEFNLRNWPIVSISDVCTVGSSKRIYQSEQTFDGVPFLRISDLNHLIDTGDFCPSLFISEEKYHELQQHGQVPIEGDILVTSRGTLGRCYIIKNTDRFYFQDGMISLISNLSNEITSLFIAYLFDMQSIKRQIESMQAGSTVSYLSIDMIKRLKIMLPDRNLQKQFGAFVDQTNKSKLTIQQSLDKLEVLKKALMQQYFRRGVFF